MTIPIVAVGEGSEELIGGLERLHGPVTVVRRCAELAELLAACQSGLARAAFIAEGSSELTATLVDRLAAVGVAVLVLMDDVREAGRLRGIGAVVVGAQTDAAALAEQITDVVGARTGTRPGSIGPVLPEGGMQAAGMRTDAERTGPGGVAGSHQDGGTILAVWGPAGAPGRTLVAVNIAAELAASGKSVLLVDADTYGASVASSLGLLDESAGLAQACRLADQGLLNVESLTKVATPVIFAGGQLRVLTGLTRPDRWPELRKAALGMVLARSREVADVTVIDCGFCLESDEALSYDTVAPQRNAATLGSLAAADLIFAVGSADAVGVPRLVRGLAELRAAVPGTTTKVVLNKMRTGAAGRGPERALKLAWERFGPGSEIDHFLPWDPSPADRTMLAGQLLREAAAGSVLHRAISALVCAPVQRSRKSAVLSATARLRVSR
ncbi:tyrosine-protein kinase family protein [Paenarthrobacter sp. Z7-10]|uniref:AAA family ATPase n=1 Tax=Paenarthrobacter sp. Z7-10 TaxID=2787635 RepID=UPI0022A959BB|nr:P-loop NTPase [Paenarthrobacter sp. Z7-10]MCZ2402787.1 tyrosine-protein kinase family protein [Paenarthrobacter sp. Z7-10]